MLLTCVVDQNVQPAELPADLLDGLAAEPLVTDIAGKRDASTIILLDQATGFRSVFFLTQIGESHVGPLVGKQQGHRSTDATIATRGQDPSGA